MSRIYIELYEATFQCTLQMQMPLFHRLISFMFDRIIYQDEV